MIRRTRRPLAALILVSLVAVGCSNDSEPKASNDSTAAGTATTSDRVKAVRFSQCMRDEGVTGFPDPDASGELTADGVANGTGLDTDSPAWDAALEACKELQPAGFTGRERSADEQDSALLFAQCMRENGVEDFPDPEKNGPLIDTRRIPSAQGRGARDIPGFDAAAQKCRDVYTGDLGDR